MSRKVDKLAGYRRASELFFALSPRELLTPEQRINAWRAAMYESMNPATRYPQMWRDAAQRMLPL